MNLRELVYKVIKSVTPSFLKKWLKKFSFNMRLNNIKKAQHSKLKSVRTKEKFRVVFFLIHQSVWKYEGLYKLLEKNNRFDPVVLVCPYISQGREVMLKEMNQAFEAFQDDGYNVVKTLNEENGQWVDVYKDFDPDIVFFTNQYALTKEDYYIYNFLEKLTCYVPYFFVTNDKSDSNYGKDFHSFLWKAYYETEIHKDLAVRYSKNRAENVVVTGYPALDIYFDKDYKPKDPWKIKDREVKRIIWAPHHTIEGQGSGLDYSNFLEYADFMLLLAKKYQSKIQISFKPHPLLQGKLYNHPDWGRSKTDEYYKTWENLKNGQLNLGAYKDLFLTSDALIHDCSSFMVEYLSTEKPSLYTVKDDDVANRMNKFGQMAFEMHYQAKTMEDVDSFIIDQVINSNKDDRLPQRKDFIEKYLKQENGNSASYNIYIDLCKELNILKKSHN